jgi:polyketide synthase 7
MRWTWGVSLAGRSVFEHRAVVIGGDRAQLLAGLAGLACGAPGAGVVVGRAGPVGKTVMVFPGQGSQWVGMGAQLLDDSPVFAEQMRCCGEALGRFVDWSLLEVVRGAPGAAGLDRVDVVQPVLWAVMVSLAQMWRAVGVVPDAVIGHSQGEIAAAYVAGALSLEDAAAVVALRSRLLVQLAGGGGMVSVACGVQRVRQWLPRWADRLSVAAVNGVSAVVVSGEVAALEELVQHCDAEGVRARRIEVDYASHSVQVDAIREGLTEALAGIAPRPSSVAFFSTVTGGLVDAAGLDGEYWYRGIRQPVEFEQAVRGAVEHGYSVFIESSPHPVLLTGIEETLMDCGADAADAVVVPTLGRDDGGLERFWTSAGQLFVAGVDLDWSAVFAGSGGQRVELPTYAFQRRRYWLTPVAGASDAASLGLGPAEHALLGAVMHQPDGAVVLTGRLSVTVQRWLADHVVAGVVIFPGAGFVELAIRAADEVGCAVVEELMLAAPLVLPGTGGVQLQVVVGAVGESGARAVSVYARGEHPDAEWMLHAEGVLGHGGDEPSAPGPDVSPWPPTGAVAVDISQGYPQLAERGYVYGPAFQGVQAVWRRGHEVFAEVAVPEDCGVEIDGVGIHPALLDAALHAAGLANPPTTDQLQVPFSWQHVTLHAARAARLRVRITPTDADTITVELSDTAGLPVLTVAALTTRPLNTEHLQAALTAAAGETGQGLLEVVWSPITVDTGPSEELTVLSWNDFHDTTTRADTAAAGAGGDVVVWELGSADADAGVVGAVYAATHAVLEVLQSWLAGDQAGRLVILTRGAVGLTGHDITDLAGAAVWGLVRSAQAEHPGRIMLIDTDTPVDVAALAAAGEPQLIVRTDTVCAARLASVDPTAALHPLPTTTGDVRCAPQKRSGSSAKPATPAKWS